MSEYVYAVRAQYNEFDDIPHDVYSIHKTRATAEAFIAALIAEEKQDLAELALYEEGTELRGYVIEAYELKE